MDCKRVKQAVYDLGILDDEALAPEAREHLSRCHACGKEFAWFKTLREDLRSLKLPEPNPAMWDTMARRIQTRLMVGEESRIFSSRWEEWRARFTRPAWAYGFAVSALILATVMWSVPAVQTPTVATHSIVSAVTPKSDLATYLPSPSTNLDPTIFRVLDSFSERELRACVKELIHRAIDRRELAALADDPVVAINNDLTLEQDIYQMDNRELQQLASMLSGIYPR